MKKNQSPYGRVPVFDVRKSEVARERAEEQIKERNRVEGSKYIRASYSLKGYSYNMSMKNKFSNL